MSYKNYGNVTVGGPYGITDTSYSIDTSTSANYNFGMNNMNNITLSGVGAIGSITPSYTIAGSNGAWGEYTNTSASVKLGKDGIEVTESADIKLGNISLKNFIDRIEQRLALLNPNPKLEEEWTELKELGDRYRELEKQITEKMKTWDILERED